MIAIGCARRPIDPCGTARREIIVAQACIMREAGGPSGSGPARRKASHPPQCLKIALRRGRDPMWPVAWLIGRVASFTVSRPSQRDTVTVKLAPRLPGPTMDAYPIGPSSYTCSVRHERCPFAQVVDEGALRGMRGLGAPIQHTKKDRRRITPSAPRHGSGPLPYRLPTIAPNRESSHALRCGRRRPTW